VDGLANDSVQSAEGLPRMKSLLDKARAEKPRSSRVCLQSLMPVVHELRQKSFTFADIYDWMKRNQVPVHKKLATFTSSTSLAYKKYLKKSID
jgi:hypothetical protein